MVNLIEWLRYNCSLFRCDLNLLRATLCTRSIQTREGNIVKALDCNAAVAGRDVLAKTVYARLFDWYVHYQCGIVIFFFLSCTNWGEVLFIFCCSTRLVDKINKAVGQDINSRMQIGILDIYGFESFKDNR